MKRINEYLYKRNYLKYLFEKKNFYLNINEIAKEELG